MMIFVVISDNKDMFRLKCLFALRDIYVGTTCENCHSLIVCSDTFLSFLLEA